VPNVTGASTIKINQLCQIIAASNFAEHLSHFFCLICVKPGGLDFKNRVDWFQEVGADDREKINGSKN